MNVFNAVRVHVRLFLICTHTRAFLEGANVTGNLFFFCWGYSHSVAG